MHENEKRKIFLGEKCWFFYHSRLHSAQCLKSNKLQRRQRNPFRNKREKNLYNNNYYETTEWMSLYFCVFFFKRKKNCRKFHCEKKRENLDNFPISFSLKELWNCYFLKLWWWVDGWSCLGQGFWMIVALQKAFERPWCHDFHSN